MAPEEHLRAQNGAKDYGMGGLIYRIRPLGVELWCAAHGIRGDFLREFLNPKVNFDVNPDIILGDDFGLITALPEYAPPHPTQPSDAPAEA